MTTIYLNGKFLAQRTTGVQRVARCMVTALDRLLASRAAHPGLRWVLLCPPGVCVPTFQQIEVATPGSGRAGLHAWEQIVLPWAARKGLLVSLAGSAPAFARRQVCTFHDAAVFDRPESYTWGFCVWYRWLFRRLGRRALAIVTVSAFSKRRLAATLAIDGERIQVVPNGADHLRDVVADPQFLASAGLVGKRFFLAVGSDSANKNLASVLQALERMPPAGDVGLVVAGGSRGAVFARQAPRRAGDAEARVLHVGDVDDAQLKALYGAALGLIFPSFYEGFGLPPVEAMACGCPAVVSHAGALPEVCGDAALAVDASSVDDIHNAMECLAGDADLRAQLAQRGRQQAALYAWDRSAERLHAVLEKVVQGHALAGRASPAVP